MPLRIESLVGRPPEPGRRAVAIGNFDGVHLGHLRLLQACVDSARRSGFTPAVLTFDPHPASVVSQRGAPPLIQTPRSLMRRLAETGIEELAHLRFDEATARLTPDAFVEQILLGGMNAGSVVVGQGFRFGMGRKGDVETLRRLGRDRFETVEVETLEDAGERVSSSRIREALGRGDLDEARHFLGRPYEIEGLIVQGDHRGTALGFPTANVDLEGVSALRLGVYAAEALIEGEATSYRAAVNLGLRPTFGGEEPRLEAHLIGFSGDIYGRTLRLLFLKRLRDERRFDSLREIKAQLSVDVAAAARAPGLPGLSSASTQTG